MRCGVVAVDAAAEDGDSRRARLERSAMRFGVDAARQPAHDDEPGRGELPPEAARDRGPVARGRPGSHDRDGRPREDLGLGAAPEEEARRRVVDRT